MGYGLGLGDDLGCLGCDTPGRGNIPWGYLGDDPTDISTTDFGLPGGILDPSAPPVTVGDLSTYLSTGNADPSLLSQLSSIVQAAGPAVSQIMQQYQLGQISSSQPLASNPLLRAALVTSPNQTGIGATLQSFAASPALLLGVGAIALLFLMKGRKG